MTDLVSQCASCVRFAPLRRDAEVCAAFPRGIPASVLDNELDHRTPVSGDGGLRYSPKHGSRHPRTLDECRVPAGSSAGGQFAPCGGGAFASAPEGRSAAWIKENQARYDSDPEFRAAADMIALHTQGHYPQVYAATAGSWDPKQIDLDSSKPMSGGAGLEYKNFFKGQDVAKGSPATWQQGAASLNAAIDGGKIDQPIYRGLQGRGAHQALASVKPGETFEIPGATSFTSDRGIAEKFATGRGPGQYRSPGQPMTIIEVEAGGPGVRAGALSPYKQAEVISRGKFEVVFNQETLSADRTSELRIIRLRAVR